MPSFTELWDSWKDAGDPTPYVLVDCAGLQGGAAALPLSACSQIECLFTGDLADELANVGPYLGRVESFDDSVRATVDELLRAHQGIVVVLGRKVEGEMTFSMLHRHFRKYNVVYGPSGAPLFFRYYDPRALMEVLPVFQKTQVESFFGPAELMVMYGMQSRTVRSFSQIAGELVEH